MRFRTLRALGLGLWACLLLLKLLAGSKDRTNNSLTLVLLLSSGLSSHFFFVKLTTDQPPKMHLSAVFPDTQPNSAGGWLIELTSAHCCRMMKHHTLQYTFVVDSSSYYYSASIVSESCRETSLTHPWRFGGPSSSTSSSFALPLAIRVVVALFASWVITEKKTAAHHTLKWSASSNVHYSTPPLVRSRGELFHFPQDTLQQLFTPGDLPLFWATRKSFLLPESHSRKCSTPIAHRVIRRTTSFL